MYLAATDDAGKLVIKKRQWENTIRRSVGQRNYKETEGVPGGSVYKREVSRKTPFWGEGEWSCRPDDGKSRGKKGKKKKGGKSTSISRNNKGSRDRSW